MTWRAVGVFSSGIARIPHVEALFDAERVVLRPSDAQARELDAIVGWGNKPNTKGAREYAARHGLPYWSAEDGFLRSVGLGRAGDPPLSVVLDDAGIYYDATRESRLERMLSNEVFDAARIDRSRLVLERIRAAGLSKYNDAPPGPVDLGPPRRRVLVVDQTRGDLSISGAMADASSFDAMLAAATDENPDAQIVVKTHPDVLAGKKHGYLGGASGDRVRLFASPATTAAMCEAVDRVYVVSSQLGFEALVFGKPVTCFGAPWYAGWGLTDDRVKVARRNRKRTLEEAFAAAYLRYARYLDPDTGGAGTLEQVVEHLALQRAEYARNRGTYVCYGFRFWKRNYVRAYLRCPGNGVAFAKRADDAVPADARIVVWGQRESEDVRALAARRSLPIVRVEDGFLRSVGLGSDLTTPASLVFDAQGIYYDPRGPSDLETILETGRFEPEEVARARALRERIVESGVSKYNLGGELRLPAHDGKRVVLVPGQVEDDASIRLGTIDVRTNLDLLREARAARPDALVVYKPHPDVLAGNRAGDVAPGNLADHVETHASLARCLEAADEVHTMTSLVGFEALLRGKRVVVYGIPFYAGWGLTEDRHAAPRRTRRLTLDELVCGTLLRYPRYLDRTTGRFTTPEATIARLLAERDSSATKLEVSWLRRQLRKAIHAYREVVHAP